MYEQLLYPQKHPVRMIIFIIGILLLPLSFFDLSIRDGAFTFVWSFDFVAFAASIAVSATYFLPTDNFHFQNAPFLVVLALEFMRFGTVTLFNNEIPFESYILSAYFMLGTVGVSFIYYFVAEGKMRSRLPMILWSSFLLVFATISLIVGFPPLAAYTEITEGIFVRSISGYLQFILFYSIPIIVSVALKSDHFPKKQKKKKRKE
ncbi:MAG: hypothetical protein IJY89_05870 [Clostridia bacterium]|nr:hypothetical protein [Clostridia bacterium]